MFSQPEKNVEQFHVDPGMSVADLGSGAGHYSMALSEAVGETGTVYSVEVQKDLIDKLKNNASATGIENIKPIWGDIEELRGTTLNDDLVDRVVISNTLFQVEDKVETVKEAYRILKEKGKILIVDWTDSFGGLGPHPDEVVTQQRAREILEQNGFTYETDIAVGDHHYGMVFKVNK